MSKAQRAAEAVAANHLKSNRAIAKESGLSEPTVRRARTASDDAVVDELRIGLDGKARRMPTRQDTDDEYDQHPGEVQLSGYPTVRIAEVTHMGHLMMKGTLAVAIEPPDQFSYGFLSKSGAACPRV